jgi:hypothetical protein
MLVTCVVVLGLGAVASAAFGQAQQESNAPRLKGRFVTIPPKGVDPSVVKNSALTAATTSGTLPLFTFDVQSSRDHNHYIGTMVGRSPFNNPGSVSVTTHVVPLILVTGEVGESVDPKTGIISTHPGTTTFNPTAPDTACMKAPNDVPSKVFQQSPLFNPASFHFGGTDVGKTQYIDAFQRGNFWNVLGEDVDVYHTLLGPVTFLSPIVIRVPGVYGLALATSALGPPNFCSRMGIIDIGWFDSFLTETIIPALAAKGVNPSNLPIFMVHNVVWAQPVTNLGSCCILGYHSLTGFPTPTQTYSPSDFDSTGLFGAAALDTAVASHEIGEWMDDPFGVNEVPPWGHIGQQGGCQNNLEVGDPLSGTDRPPVVMPNGFTYHLQELAFFSWFYGKPSIGIHGWFSDNGTFKTDAGPPCH